MMYGSNLLNLPKTNLISCKMIFIIWFVVEQKKKKNVQIIRLIKTFLITEPQTQDISLLIKPHVRAGLPVNVRFRSLSKHATTRTHSSRLSSWWQTQCINNLCFPHSHQNTYQTHIQIDLTYTWNRNKENGQKCSEAQVTLMWTIWAENISEDVSVRE